MCNHKLPPRPDQSQNVLAEVELTARLHDWTQWKLYQYSGIGRTVSLRYYRDRVLKSGCLTLATIREHDAGLIEYNYYTLAWAGMVDTTKTTRYCCYEDALAALKELLP